MNDILEETLESIMAESSREPDGERLWVKTSYELADLIRPILKESFLKIIGEDDKVQDIANDKEMQGWHDTYVFTRNKLRKEQRGKV